MKRFELILLGLFLACWLVYLLVVFRVLAPGGNMDLGFYPYYAIAVALGWGAGNLYVYRSRDMEPQIRRALLAGYFVSPMGLLFLLKVTMPVAFQRMAPFVGVYAVCVFSIFFWVATKLGIWRKRA